MITEWEGLEGKTIAKVSPTWRGYLLSFGDGTKAHVVGSGEERHGGHWPELSEEYEELADGT